MARPIPKPTKELLAKSDAEDQFERLDRAFRSVISVPKSTILKEEARRKRRKKRAKSKHS
jgi:hypothetical protein